MCLAASVALAAMVVAGCVCDTVVVALWLCQCLWPMGVVMAVALAVVAVGVGAVVVAAHGASPVSVAI